MALLKLIPSMESSILDYMGEHYDAVVIESFGVAVFPPMSPVISTTPSKNDPGWKDRGDDHPGDPGGQQHVRL